MGIYKVWLRDVSVELYITSCLAKWIPATLWKAGWHGQKRRDVEKALMYLSLMTKGGSFGGLSLSHCLFNNQFESHCGRLCVNPNVVYKQVA
jgi:hypothetical protein